MLPSDGNTASIGRKHGFHRTETRHPLDGNNPSAQQKQRAILTDSPWPYTKTLCKFSEQDFYSIVHTGNGGSRDCTAPYVRRSARTGHRCRSQAWRRE